MAVLGLMRDGARVYIYILPIVFAFLHCAPPASLTRLGIVPVNISKANLLRISHIEDCLYSPLSFFFPLIILLHILPHVGVVLLLVLFP